jgi:serine/threonine protein phosphatase PrpC
MNFKIFHTHKKSSLTYNFVQDKFCINPENQTIAIADGTTQSFRSEFWSELLVQEFCKHPTFETKDFLNLSKSLADKIQSSSPVFSEKTAVASLEKDKFSKGSTSTFLGIKFRDQNTFDVLTVGDCNLFIINKNGDIISHPFDSIDDLNNNQSFLNTINLLKEEPDPIEISKVQLKFEDGDKLLLCSDAISRLFLSDKKWIDEIVNFDNFDFFIRKIQDLWSAKVLEEDDITIIYMSETFPKTLYITPPVGFSFPEPPPPPFIPIPPIRGEDDSNLKLTDMDIKTIMHNFNCIQNDFIEIKKKQKFHEILLLSAVGLLSTILLVLFFNFSSEETPVVNSAPATNTEKKSNEPSKQVNDKAKTNKK